LNRPPSVRIPRSSRRTRGRHVAIKVLPDHLEKADSSSSGRALVMELVEGPTLAELIDGSSQGLGLDEALRIARQIA
jgi:hypothetical protein